MSMKNPVPYSTNIKDYDDYHKELNKEIFVNRSGQVIFYPKELEYLGFTKHAIEEALRILKEFNQKEIYHSDNIIGTEIQIGGYFSFDSLIKYQAMYAIHIEKRANDPYAILDCIIRMYNQYWEIIQLDTQEKQIEYIKKWQKEYSQILGKNILMDSTVYTFFYVYLPQFGFECNYFKKKYTCAILNVEKVHIYSTSPQYYYSFPFIHCTKNCILLNHPYFKGKIPLIPIYFTEEEMVEKLKTSYKESFSYGFLKTIDPKNPLSVKKLFDRIQKKELPIYYDFENFNTDLTKGPFRISSHEHSTMLGRPNPFFGNINITYDDKGVGTIEGEIDLEWDYLEYYKNEAKKAKKS
jgi:hypothetical protein